MTFLITTRCRFSNIRYNYELTLLDEKDGRKLFIENYETPEQLTFADESYIKEIVKASHGYPLAIELIVRAVSYQSVGVKDLEHHF